MSLGRSSQSTVRHHGLPALTPSTKGGCRMEDTRSTHHPRCSKTSTVPEFQSSRVPKSQRRGQRPAQSMSWTLDGAAVQVRFQCKWKREQCSVIMECAVDPNGSLMKLCLSASLLLPRSQPHQLIQGPNPVSLLPPPAESLKILKGLIQSQGTHCVVFGASTAETGAGLTPCLPCYRSGSRSRVFGADHH
jgi:hypothetical protein